MDSCIDDTVSSDDCDIEEPVLLDVPIDSPNVGASLPAAEELRTTTTKSSFGKQFFSPSSKVNGHSWGSGGVGAVKDRKRLLIVVGSVLVLAMVIGLSVSLSKPSASTTTSSSSVGTTPTTDQGTTNSSISAGTPRKATLEAVVKYLADANVSTAEEMNDPNSPQSKAVAWMADLDARNMPIPPPEAHPITSPAGYRYVTRYIMAILWYALKGDEWEAQANWLSGKDVCNWNEKRMYQDESGAIINLPTGASCNKDTGAISSIQLSMNNLVGTIPKEIGFLSSLMVLNFEYNGIRGGLPSQICHIGSNLKFLTVARNQLVGEIPPCLSNMTQLELLALSSNMFQGVLPDLSGMTQMERLYLDGNVDLDGSVGGMFHNMTRLTTLAAGETKLKAHVDRNFLTNCANLTQLDLSSAGFHGAFPNHILQLPSLQVLDLHGNDFHGTFPDLGVKHPSLQLLALGNNRLNGTIPESIFRLHNIIHLDLSGNQFVGPIPQAIGNLTALKRLYLADNPFSRGSIPSTLITLTSLVELSLKGTNRASTIPTFFGNFSHLELLDLDHNDLNGTIPTELGDLTDLQFLLLNRNPRLEGQIPENFAGLTNLRGVFLDNTNLGGSLDALCTSGSFNETLGDADGIEILTADCGADGANIGEVECHCCAVCCVDDKPETCHQNYLVPMLNPEWEYSYNRVDFNFGGKNGTNATYFLSRQYLGLSKP